jgi:hypothetical protein
MSESMAAANTAFEAFKAQWPDAANYFCFLGGFVAGSQFEEDENVALRARLKAAAELCEGLHEEALDAGWAFKVYNLLGIDLPDWAKTQEDA